MTSPSLAPTGEEEVDRHEEQRADKDVAVDREEAPPPRYLLPGLTLQLAMEPTVAAQGKAGGDDEAEPLGGERTEGHTCDVEA